MQYMEWEERQKGYYYYLSHHDSMPRCDKKGNFERVQCGYFGCYCVNPKTGIEDEKFGGVMFPDGEFKCGKSKWSMS